MLKRQKKVWLVAGGVFGAVGLLVIGGVFSLQALRPSTDQQQTIQPGTVQLQRPTADDSISLSPKAAEPKDPNALAVDDSQNQSANLGSGTNRQTVTAGASDTATQDFSQYEQYKDKNEVYFGDITTGTGTVASKDKQLAVTYVGYLTNGNVFDKSQKSSSGQLQPLLFTLGAGQLIPGFEQGVAGMKVGGIRRVIIPPSLGYGDKAQGGIPANAVLIFDISLIAAQ